MDLATVGTLAVFVLTTVSDAALKAAVTEAVKDGYKKLKEKIAPWVGTSLDILEKAPDSPKIQSILAEAINQQPSTDQAAVKEIALALLEALRAQEASSPVGIDVKRLEAAEVRLRNLNIAEGTGLRAETITTTGAFELDGLHVGLRGNR